MAMTQLGLLFIGAVATLSTIGMFVNFEDAWTKVVVTFLAAILWGIFGMSAYDVVIVDSYAAVLSEPIMPLVAIGLGLAFIIAVFGLYELVEAIGGEAKMDTTDSLFE